MDACSDATVATRNGAASTTRRGVSEAVEDYAKAIYALQSRQKTDAVKTNAIAHRLGVTPASASSCPLGPRARPERALHTRL